MKGKIDVEVRLNINAFTQEKRVSMFAKVKVLNSAFDGTSYGEIEVKPKHEISFSTANYLAMATGKKFDLRAKCPMVVLTNREAEFIKGVRTDGTEYYAVLVNLAEKDKEPMMRMFYLKYMDAKSVKEFGSLYEFTTDTRDIEALDTPEITEE